MSDMLPAERSDSEFELNIKVCLIGPATETDFTDAVLMEQLRKKLPPHAPIGVLTLAAVLEQHAASVDIVDLNLIHRDYLVSADKQEIEFCDYASRVFQDIDCDVFGFGTICGSYPVTIRIAEQVKRFHPSAKIIFGGPQASVVDRETLAAFDFIDVVVRGEAEESLPRLLHRLQHGLSLEDLVGITYRDRSAIVRTENAPVIKDLDEIPLPAYHLQPSAKDHHLSIELGRGCPFACTFCSTNDFFRRNYRLKSPETVLSQMDFLYESYGVATFDLVHDMFTVDRKKVVKFCDLMIASGRNYKWSCSARTDCVDQALLALMHRAGCRGIFFGIETGSARLQKVVKKNIDLDEVRTVMRWCDALKIRATASLITGFPDETLEDVFDTAGMFVEFLRHDYVEPQLHLLSPLAGTYLQKTHADSLTFDSIISDMSYQGWEQNVADQKMIVAYPEIFPNFYGIPMQHVDRTFLSELRNFLITGMERFHWLLVSLQKIEGNIVPVFQGFLAWLQADDAAARRSDKYYGSVTFLGDFLRFVQNVYVTGDARGAGLIEVVLEFENSLKVEEDRSPQARAQPRSHADASYATIASGVRIIALKSDFACAIKQLRSGDPAEPVPRKDSTVITRYGETGRYEVIQLSDFSSTLLLACAAGGGLEHIRSSFIETHGPQIDGVPAGLACDFGLHQLEQKGYISVH